MRVMINVGKDGYKDSFSLCVVNSAIGKILKSEIQI